MSQFDNGKSPAYVPPGAILAADNGSFSFIEGNQTATTILASSSLSATTAIAGISNFGCKGALFLLDISAMPASGSVGIALKLQITSPRTAVFATTVQFNSVGIKPIMAYPGVAAGGSASLVGLNVALPRTFGARISLSTGATSKECILSLHMMRIL